MKITRVKRWGMKLTIEIIKDGHRVFARILVNDNWWKTIEPEFEYSSISDILNCIEHSLIAEGVNFEEE